MTGLHPGVQYRTTQVETIVRVGKLTAGPRRQLLNILLLLLHTQRIKAGVDTQLVGGLRFKVHVGYTSFPGVPTHA